MLDWKTLCDRLFPGGHDVTLEDGVLHGSGNVGGRAVAVVGTTDHAAIGAQLAMKLAARVLAVVREHPGRPILALVDTQGQQLSRFDELIGNNACLAHLAKCFAVARQRGHRLLSVVYSEAVSGGFLALGMLADETYAVEDAQIRVMALPAMSRVTKLPLEQLEELCRTTSILGPGVANFVALGCVEDIWHEPLDACLAAALDRQAGGADMRAELGAQRSGRTAAHDVMQRVRNYVQPA